MTETVHLPALGEEVFPGQQIGPAVAPADKQWYVIVTLDRWTRLIRDLIIPGDGESLSTNPLHKGLPQPNEMMLFWGPTSGGNRPARGEYLPYPPLVGDRPPSSVDPINQYARGPTWRNILSGFAHDIMAFNPRSNHLRDAGTHETGHQPPDDAATTLKNKVTYQLGRAVIGVAFHRISQWMEFDAYQLAVAPGTVPDSRNWKIWETGTIPVAEDEIPIPNMGDMMAMLCGDDVKEVAGFCVGAWVYLLNERVDGSSYNSNLNSGGEIRLPDPSWDTWRPNAYLHRVTGTRSERSDQWDEIMGWYRDAHDHYLESVAPSVEHN